MLNDARSFSLKHHINKLNNEKLVAKNLDITKVNVKT